MTIRELLHAPSPVARDERTLLLAHALAKPKEWLITHDDVTVAPATLRAFWRLLARRAEGEPFAYLIGEKWFYGRPFKVTKATLIPRPATETLIASVIPTEAQRSGGIPPTIVDIGTGSGAIAVTLSAEIPKARVIAIDVSQAALNVARANAKRHGVRVKFLKRDIRKEGSLRSLRSVGMTVLVANLPYIRTGDWKKLDRGVTGHEPRLALTSGKDGLDHYRALLRRLGEAKLSPALMLLEADPWQMSALRKLVQATLPQHRIELRKDLHNDERVLVASSKFEVRNSK